MTERPRILRAYGLDVCLDDLVYKPADDTYLVAELITSNPHLVRGMRVLELGSGTGILSALAASLGAREVFSIDVNPSAALTTLCTLSRLDEKTFWHVALCDLAGCLRKGAKFDVLVFNPPYLPLEGPECEDPLARAWCGGPTGVEVVLRALELLNDLGPPINVIIVSSSLSDRGKVIERLRDLGYDVEVPKALRFFFEEISLLVGRRRER